MSEASSRAADPEEHKKLHRLGGDPAVVTLALSEGEPLEVAASAERRGALLGPSMAGAESA